MNDPRSCALYSACCSTAAWRPLVTDTAQWIQADLGESYLLYSVTTQGHGDADLWVTSYYVSFGYDGIGWVDLATLYTANTDRNTKVSNALPPDTIGQFLRLRPQTWNSAPALRFDVIGKLSK